MVKYRKYEVFPCDVVPNTQESFTPLFNMKYINFLVDDMFVVFQSEMIDVDIGDIDDSIHRLFFNDPSVV